MKGYIHSLESFGTVDGPGVRYVVFFQGCPMRCLYCHNPDTWKMGHGMQLESTEIIEKLKRNRMFYTSGGLTATGGEPLLQMEFLTELFQTAKAAEIHTCLDTSGILFDRKNAKKLEQFEALLNVTDLVMLDIKHMDEEAHRILTGHSNESVLDFAKFLDEKKIPLWVRHVVVPQINDDEDEWRTLGRFLKTLSNFEHLEVLPYHTMGKHKYELLGMNYPLGNTRALSKEEAMEAERIILEEIRS